MSRPFWLRPLPLAEKPADSVAKAAAHGEPLETLLRTGAACLLEAANADRAGVWAEEVAGEPLWRGQLAQVEGIGPASASCNVNSYEAFPVEFNDMNAPLEFFAPVFPVGPRDFFEGMSTAVGMPLKVGDCILGALLACSRRPGKLAGRQVLENIAAEIAVSVYSNRSREQNERTHQALHLREEIENLIASGAPAEDVLRRILSVVVRQTGAQFAGVARRMETSLRWEAFSGTQAPEALQRAFFALATAVFLDRESILREIPNGSLPGLSVVGLPLSFSRDESLVLLAGYRCGDRIPLETLEGFRAVATNARAASTGREADSAYRSLFESSTEALIVADCKGRILEANRYARELLPWKSDLGSTIAIAEFFAQPGTSEFDAWFSRAASDPCVTPMEAQLENGLEVRLGLRQMLAGSQRLLLALEEGSVVGRAERLWKQTHAELCSVLDAVQCGVVVLSADGRIRFANAQFGALFGLDARRLRSLGAFNELAAAIESCLRSPACYRAPWNLFAAGSGDAVHDELEVRTPAARVIKRYARPVLDDEGRRFGWLEVYWDITSQRQLESKLLQTEKMASVGQVATGIAHELNNPLTSIIVYAQLLLERNAPEAQRDEGKMIFDEAERARRIVKNLLSFARPVQHERARVDINEIIERTVALRGYELKLRNIAVRCELEPGLPATFADPHQLQQVVLNLLVNAEQAIAENHGHGVIQVRTRKSSADRLVIEISDNGRGIAPEISSQIFDLFFTTKSPEIGTGLGLAIVRSIVEQHEGEVAFENLPQGGAKFTVQLPVLPVPAIAAATPAAKTGEPAAAAKSRAARILIVEDEPTVAHLIADVLREDGNQVEAVLDSQEGLLRVSRSYYDLVICDLRMPRVDGPAFYGALVRSGNTARHRILFITGDMLGPHTVEFLQSHQLQHLAKPFLVEELKLAVYRVLARGGAAVPTNLASAEAHG
ncbi:MAG TPA: ATP-binding protein [Candidatus Acidoferrales bacterium]|nr:ATP-binding protein [Candidatus Acidoferrales bacterium]